MKFTQMENYHTRTSRAVTAGKSRLKAYPKFQLHIRVSSIRLKLSADLAAFVAVDCTREGCALIESDCKKPVPRSDRLDSSHPPDDHRRAVHHFVSCFWQLS